MIQSFADPETELIWLGRPSRKLPPDIQNVALRKLRLLNQARTPTIFAFHLAIGSKP